MFKVHNITDAKVGRPRPAARPYKCDNFPFFTLVETSVCHPFCFLSTLPSDEVIAQAINHLVNGNDGHGARLAVTAVSYPIRSR